MSSAPTLYHYTSVGTLQKIVDGKSLWATEARFLNDASELTYFIDRMIMWAKSTEFLGPKEIVDQFQDWLRSRRNDSGLVFVTCFSENPNQLSQWRGYTEYGSGISIGFDRFKLNELAEEQGYELAKVDYDSGGWAVDEARKLIHKLLVSAHDRGPNPKANLAQSYHYAFEEALVSVLSISARFKHSAFQEEAEWRLISKPLTRYADENILFREGKYNLIPYKRFELRDPKRLIRELIVGPTPRVNESMAAISYMLSNTTDVSKSSIRVWNSGIPYRD